MLQNRGEESRFRMEKKSSENGEKYRENEKSGEIGENSRDFGEKSKIIAKLLAYPIMFLVYSRSIKHEVFYLRLQLSQSDSVMLSLACSPG